MRLLLALQGMGLASSLTIPWGVRSSHARSSVAIMSSSSDAGGPQYITPVGPFCPFRSEATKLDGTVDSGMGSLASKSQSFMADMARLQLDSQMGTEPDPVKVEAVANEVAAALEEWELLMTRLRLSTDFQSREYFKLTEAHLSGQGQSLQAIGLAMRWQVDAMRAFAKGQMPPMPPAGLDLEAMSRQQEQGGGGGGMAGALGGPPAIDTTPFDGSESAFESPVVKEEYEALCREHAALVSLGASYGSYDALGKLAFLDALDAVEGRWDIFFTRFSLVGALNADFKRQSDAFLQSMGLSPQSFRALLGKAHQIMRDEAEAERQ